MEYAKKSPEALAKEGYDAQAIRYLQWTLSRPSAREKYVQNMLSLLPDPSCTSVLELGCGAGLPVTRMLAETCHDVVANDISSTQISLARRHLAEVTNVSFMEGSMGDLVFHDSKFDVIVALYSIIHLDAKGQEHIFERMRRWIKPGGMLLVNLVVMALPAGLTIEGWLGMKAAYWSSFGQEGNLRLVQGKGFEVLRSEVTEEAEDVAFEWFIARAGNQKD
ncbi:MAG: hypothetical protein LQ340_004923 [Diploschistes diacapsis]|nr:MAG: hypothetical protein LQ340_004923 [Diploschistes diacapsis]